MSASERPGGLTALAVISIVIGVMSLFSPIGMYQMNRLELTEEQQEDPESQQILAYKDLTEGQLVTMSVLGVAQGLLYVISGTGFLKLKRVRGYVLGNLGAVVAIGAVALSMLILPDTIAEGRLSLGTITNLIYPGLCLYLLNLVFREDLTK